MAKKKITAITVLREMDCIYRRIKFPNARYYYHDTNINESNANKLTGAVIKFIELSGYQAERINTQGRRIDTTKRLVTSTGFNQTVGSVSWQKGTGTKGTADISAIGPGGISIKIEIKFGKDRQSEAQKKYEEKVNAVGGVYIIVRTFEQFLIWWTFKYGRTEIMQQAIDNLKTNK